ncbi:S4 domain-containing protein, partial [Asaia platycodi]|uniref:S4 domain-containing protein n=1 Tax=Asaia platycodi TaxID=610243 RepID=UPI000556ADB5
MTDASANISTRFDFRVTPEQAGQRLDRFLADAIGSLSRSRVKSLIEAGQVYCDGTIIREPSETT